MVIVVLLMDAFLATLVSSFESCRPMPSTLSSSIVYKVKSLRKTQSSSNWARKTIVSRCKVSFRLPVSPYLIVSMCCCPKMSSNVPECIHRVMLCSLFCDWSLRVGSPLFSSVVLLWALTVTVRATACSIVSIWFICLIHLVDCRCQVRRTDSRSRENPGTTARDPRHRDRATAHTDRGLARGSARQWGSGKQCTGDLQCTATDGMLPRHFSRLAIHIIVECSRESSADRFIW